MQHRRWMSTHHAADPTTRRYCASWGSLLCKPMHHRGGLLAARAAISLRFAVGTRLALAAPMGSPRRSTRPLRLFLGYASLGLGCCVATPARAADAERGE